MWLSRPLEHSLSLSWAPSPDPTHIHNHTCQKLGSSFCRARVGFQAKSSLNSFASRGRKSNCGDVEDPSPPFQVWSPSLGSTNSHAFTIWFSSTRGLSEPPRQCVSISPQKCGTAYCALQRRRYKHLLVMTWVTNTHSLTGSLIGNVNQCNRSVSDLHIRSIICTLEQSVLHPGDATRG